MRSGEAENDQAKDKKIICEAVYVTPFELSEEVPRLRPTVIGLGRCCWKSRIRGSRSFSWIFFEGVDAHSEVVW